MALPRLNEIINMRQKPRPETAFGWAAYRLCYTGAISHVLDFSKPHLKLRARDRKNLPVRYYHRTGRPCLSHF